MPANMNDGWPSCGEIDIMEQVSYETDAHQTVHTHYANDLGKIDPLRSITKPFNAGQFNTYGINWTPEMVQFTINGQVTFSYPNMHLSNEAAMKQWPFNKPFYLILNFALGGQGTWPGTITDSELPANMEVDWVRVTSN
jgi:beta-glucanase (GH16 family)